MTDGTDQAEYLAFISYSHREERIASWLHRKLETYRIPPRLVGRPGSHGPVPARLTPLFRDRLELSASGNLSAQVQTALAASSHMVLLCSPAAAKSEWVNREIELFRELHPEGQIIPAIVEGTHDNAFPPALLATGEEPIAADFHEQKDGKRLAMLKVAAGLAGVGLDQLIQRDAQRKVRRVMFVTALAVTAMIAFAFLSWFAITARNDAEQQRVEAEGLVEFMLTDLRDRLRGVGRLDVLTAVNERALGYYEGQPLEGLPSDSLDRRARILQAMGEDDLGREDFQAAKNKFAEARRVTAALVAEDPENPERLYAHAQSEFWVGVLASNMGRYDILRETAESYKDLADQMVAIEPHSPRYRDELRFALNGLCSMEVQAKASPDDAEARCADALANAQQNYAERPDEERKLSLSISHAWYADALVAAGKLEEASRQREMQLALSEDLVAAQPNNKRYQSALARAFLKSAELAFDRGEIEQGREIGEQGIAALETLVTTDPDNAAWQNLLDRLKTQMQEEN
ncbi:toll/interleukin-1 receptor domain-containing protein [Pacificimonas sp. WHA3]|uniref:Toll/interleukin-1 receptor domain-containing protein n=1 Tax=Pacificimonas pallii TaxID=2827236 RepID=A0ABS6SAU8_9SPHN|nr:toll/interleukin-1 receptor domain-containing protein [Pacificimonas pallii]MBV7255426.1 toll/interleukin-1 receptor domain-containing protein [Pacificimonas pallii]